MINSAVRTTSSKRLCTASLQVTTAATAATVNAFSTSSRQLARNSRVQCCYTNSTRLFQIIRMVTAVGSFLEKAVPPQARVFFNASLQDYLEVHTGSPITSIAADRIPCEQLACTKSWSA